MAGMASTFVFLFVRRVLGLVSLASGWASIQRSWRWSCGWHGRILAGADLWRVRQARDEGVGDLGAQHPAPTWLGACAEAGRPDLRQVPPLPGRRGSGVRLL